MPDYDDRRLRLAKTLSAAGKRRVAPVGFNMSHWLWFLPSTEDRAEHDKSGHSCGTVACLAGHAVIQSYMDEGYSELEAVKRADTINNSLLTQQRAMEYLGLSFDQSEDLFCMTNTPASMEPVTPRQAADVLHKLVRTGEVDWSAVARAQGREWDR